MKLKLLKVSQIERSPVPNHLRQQREERREDVGDGEVQNEEVHPRHLRPAKRRKFNSQKKHFISSLLKWILGHKRKTIPDVMG